MTASFYLSMLIKNIDPKKLIPYENNPRLNDQAVEAVKASIEEFGCGRVRRPFQTHAEDRRH